MGFPLPSTLTPSKISRFVSCPLAFRYSYLEHLPEPSTIHQVRGTLVHRCLQLLYSEHGPGERTGEVATDALATAYAELEQGADFESADLDAKERVELRHDAEVLLERYFTLEDPDGVHPVGLEMDLRCDLEGIELRGIIDRLDYLDGDDFAIVDYKTGRSPRPEQSRARLAGVQFYAYLCEQVLGRLPREVRVMYLRDRVVVVESPTEQTMRGLRQRALAVWHAIERACETGDFRPNPSRLCSSCSFQSQCPAFGGASETGMTAK
jgi:putative RecB family exonuclease